MPRKRGTQKQKRLGKQRKIKLKPESFDVLGVITFPFIFVVALWMLITNKMPPLWLKIVLLIIGVCGTAIDGSIVFIKFIKNRESILG